MKKWLLVLFIFFSAISYSQTIRHVPSQYSTIQAALDAAQNGDTVLVQPGTYKENIVWPNTNGIKLIADGDTSNTFIDGEKKGSCIVIPSYNLDTTTCISGFSIINGYSSSNGGGIAIMDNSLILEKLNLYNNSTKNQLGGAISVSGYSASPILRKLKIYNNNSWHGGGIYIYSGSNKPVIIDKCIMLSNKAVYAGGALKISGATLITNCIFLRNTAGVIGGAISTSVQTTFLNNYFIDNSADDNGDNDNSTFADAGNSLHIEGNDHVISHCNFYGHLNSNNAAILCYGNAKINNNNFFVNGFALSNQNNSNVIDAASNWWNSPSGPTIYPQNPLGRGDSVSHLVNFTPFLTECDTAANPPLVQNVKIVNIQSSDVELKWDKALIKDVKGYKIYYSEHQFNGTYESSVNAGNVNNFVLTGLLPGKNYYISVTCYDNSNNESWYSNEIAASTVFAPRISADLSNIDFGTVDVRTNNAKSLKITNTGTAALNLKTIQLVNTSFGYSLNTRKLEPGTSTTFIALFSPKSKGAYKVDLKIVSDAVNDSILVIPVTGSAVSPKAPFIVSVNDVPNDQGGQVRITFQPSRYDGVDSLQKISSYSVWRKMDENKWDAINQFNAVGDSLYYVVAPSLGDSTVNGAVLSTYKVTAHTTDPLIFYTSEPAAGYSKDNIAPEVPKGFTASVANNRVYLKWNPSKEKDFQYYAIYRSTDPNFSADTMKKYTYTTIDTAYVDNNVSMNQKYYYKIAAVDYAGNRSTSTNAEIAVLSDVNDTNKNIPTEYALEQNFPNPFNPSTIIRYALPYESRVKISIFNSLGQMVNELVDMIEAGGNHEKTFNAGNLPSGIYIYSINVQSTNGKNSFSSVKKMMLIK